MSPGAWMCWMGMVGCVGVYGWVWEKAGEKRRAWLEWGLAALVAGVSLASVLTHEPWRDELHAWFQARNLSVGGLWREMAYEGHFLPWYLILHPFAMWGAPVETMGWISWAINAATIAWFSRKSPLSGWAKSAVALSCMFLYVNPVITRCYVLVPVALFGLATLWEKRDRLPVVFGFWVALLANTHVCMEGTAGLVFLVFASENVLRRKDGKNWRVCGRQWAGLGVMAAGGALALAQVLPSLWSSNVDFGHPSGWKTNMVFFSSGCNSWAGSAAVAAGVILLLGMAWRENKAVFSICAGSLAFIVCFSVFVYPANVINRALLWFPLVVFSAWLLEGRREQVGQGRFVRTTAIVAMGLGIARPDMTLADWRWEYDVLPGACRHIVEQYGKNAEVWINGEDKCVEAASVYLGNTMDWRTGERPQPVSLSRNAKKPPRLYSGFLEDYFAAHPERESVLVLASLSDWSGLTPGDVKQSRVEVAYSGFRAVGPWSVPVVLLKVGRDKSTGNDSFGMRAKMAVVDDDNREGKLGAASEVVRRTEGGEEGAKEAEALRESLRNVPCTMQMQNAQ